MNSVLLAVFGSIITAIAFAGFSVYQLEKTAADLGKSSPDKEPPAGPESAPNA